VAAGLAGIAEGAASLAEAAMSASLLVSQADPGRHAKSGGKLGPGIAGMPGGSPL
jgi:hypothetical protein